MEVTFYSKKRYISQLLDTFSEVKPYKIDLWSLSSYDIVCWEEGGRVSIKIKLKVIGGVGRIQTKFKSNNENTTASFKVSYHTEYE